MELPFDIGFLLVGISCVSLIWGIGCAIVGGMLRFDLAQYVNQYLQGLQSKKINEISKGMIEVGWEFQSVDLGPWPKIIGVIAILVGITVIVYSIIGALGGLLKNTTLLFVLIGTVLMCIMMQFVLLWMIFDSDNNFHDRAKDENVSMLKEKYSLGPKQNDYSKVMNSIMIMGECCGVRGSKDFGENLTYVHPDGERIYLQTSPACCKSQIWDEAAKDFNKLLECVREREQLNTEGCYKTLFDDAKDGAMGTFFVLLILMMMWELLVIGAAVGVLFWQEDEIRSGLGGSKTGHEDAVASGHRTSGEARLSIFTPFSKISSFQSADINRIKSTEIW